MKRQRIKLMDRRNSYFTLVEMFIIISIVGLLAGMALPMLAKARARAKYERWLMFNAQANRDPGVVINYNFEAVDFQTRVDGIYTPTLYNGAMACNMPGYDSANYNGILSTTVLNQKIAALNLPQWAPGAGRWPALKNAMQFNGGNGYVNVPGTQCVNFDPATRDFTILTWVNFNTVAKVQCLFSKNSSLAGASQYSLFLNGAVCARVGNATSIRPIPPIQSATWLHLAVVNKARAGVKIYLNGTLMTGDDSTAALPTSVQTPHNLTLGASSNGDGAGGAPRLSNWFTGLMDEFMLYNRALPEAEIRQHYRMGAP